MTERARFAYFYNPHKGVVQRVHIATWGKFQVRLDGRTEVLAYRTTLPPDEVDETPEAAVARYKARCELVLRNAEAGLVDKRQAVADARALVVAQLTVEDVR